jgi:putative IMPACT (imprinted ancient) family translation regulator
MDKLEVMTLVDTTTCMLTFNYSLENQIKHLLKTENIPILQADYTEQVSFTLEVPKADMTRLNAAFIHITSGQASLKPVP